MVRFKLSGFLILGLVILTMLSTSSVSCAREKLILGIHPYLSASMLHEKFIPLEKYLEEKTGYKVQIKIAKNYEEQIAYMGQNWIDIGYLGPASYIKMVKAYGEKPLLARIEVNGKPTYRGVIFVSKDSPIHSLKDLAGKRFAFGDPNSTMSHLVPRAMMLKAGVDIKDLAMYRFLDNYDNVALGVLTGHFDAGAVKYATFEMYKDRGLVALDFTPKISEHLFVASGELPEELVEKLRAILLGASSDPEGMKAIKAINEETTGLVEVEDSDYNSLRDILSTLDKAGITY